MMQPMNGGISENNKPRIEIKSLCQEVCNSSDKILEALMNEGWQVLGAPGYTSVTVPNVSAPGWRIKHFEVIKLWRRVEQQPSDPLKAATNYSSVVERISTASPPTPLPRERGETQVICGLPGGPQGMRPSLDEVTYLEALASNGQYTEEEVRYIADRENFEAMVRRAATRQSSSGVKPPTSKRTTPLLSQ